ncbi:Reverse transcriptase domain-containing protein [Balamuthia mandrillaris]
MSQKDKDKDKESKKKVKKEKKEEQRKEKSAKEKDGGSFRFSSVLEKLATAKRKKRSKRTGIEELTSAVSTEENRLTKSERTRSLLHDIDLKDKQPPVKESATAKTTQKPSSSTSAVIENNELIREPTKGIDKYRLKAPETANKAGSLPTRRYSKTDAAIRPRLERPRSSSPLQERSKEKQQQQQEQRQKERDQEEQLRPLSARQHLERNKERLLASSNLETTSVDSDANRNGEELDDKGGDKTLGKGAKANRLIDQFRKKQLGMPVTEEEVKRYKEQMLKKYEEEQKENAAVLKKKKEFVEWEKKQQKAKLRRKSMPAVAYHPAAVNRRTRLSTNNLSNRNLSSVLIQKVKDEYQENPTHTVATILGFVSVIVLVVVFFVVQRILSWYLNTSYGI